MYESFYVIDDFTGRMLGFISGRVNAESLASTHAGDSGNSVRVVNMRGKIVSTVLPDRVISHVNTGDHQS